MDLYQKNIKILAKYYPGMDQNIEEALKIEEKIEIKEEISDDKVNILKIKKEGHVYYLSGKRNARKPPQEWLLEQGDIPENYTFIIMGTGNVGYLQELFENVDVHLNIMIYEPSVHIFQKALNYIDLEKIMEKHTIIFWIENVGGMTINKLDLMLERLMKLERLKNLQLFALPNYDIIFKEEWELLFKKCKEAALSNRVSYNTAIAFSASTSINVLKNARYLCDGYKTIQLFRAIPTDVTGIVVAAGPSLNKNIKELKKAKGKAFIIAVDTALKPLLQEGIIPDMFFIVDAQKPLDLIKEEEVRKIPMVTTLNATPEILEYHKGKKFFFDENYQFAENIMLKSGLRWGGVETGGSVATNAFSLLYKLGLKTIILVGQDLALTGNKTHADGTFEEHMPEIDTKNYEWIEGNVEKKVPTRTDFKVFLNWYVYSIQQYKEHVKEFRVINATEGGAKIAGTDIMTLKNAITETCTKEVDIKKCLDNIEPMLSQEKRKWAVDYLKNIPDKFKELEKNAESLYKHYCRVGQLCKKQKMDSEQYYKLLTKIKNKIKKIESNALYQLVILTVPSATQIMRNEADEQMPSMKEEGIEIARKGKLYMKIVKDTAKILCEESQNIYADFN